MALVSTAVVTDSTCDLPSATLLDMGVVAVPLVVRIGDEDLRDGRDLRPADLYRRMRAGGPVPRTRPPDPDDFAAAYRYALAHADAVVSVHLSAKLSETLTHAHEGAKRAGAADRVRIVDSRSTSSAMAEQVLAAARAAAAGRGPDEVAAAAERVRDATMMVLAPESLHWLREGGRIGRARSLLGGMLALRPILALEDGEIVPVAMVRRARRIDGMAAWLEAHAPAGPLRAAVGVADDDLALADPLLRRLEAGPLHLTEGRVQRIGAATCAHLGPGTLTAAVYAEDALVAP